MLIGKESMFFCGFHCPHLKLFDDGGMVQVWPVGSIMLTIFGTLQKWLIAQQH